MLWAKHWRPHRNVWRWRRLIIVPALASFACMGMQRAIGTSLLIIALVSLSGTTSHIVAGKELSLATAVLFTAGSLVGLFIGSWLAHAHGRTNASASVCNLHSTGRIVCHPSKPHTVALQPVHQPIISKLEVARMSVNNGTILIVFLSSSFMVGCQSQLVDSTGSNAIRSTTQNRQWQYAIRNRKIKIVSC